MSNGRITCGILRENYGSKQEIIDSFGMHKGALSRVDFLAKLIKDRQVLGFTYLPTQKKVIF